jgi:hypothetical protein
MHSSSSNTNGNVKDVNIYITTIITIAYVPIRTTITVTTNTIYTAAGSRDSIVSIATGYGLDDRVFGVRVPVGSRIFSSPRRPDRPWGPPNLLSNGNRGLFPLG